MHRANLAKPVNIYKLIHLIKTFIVDVGQLENYLNVSMSNKSCSSAVPQNITSSAAVPQNINPSTVSQYLSPYYNNISFNNAQLPITLQAQVHQQSLRI